MINTTAQGIDHALSLNPSMMVKGSEKACMPLFYLDIEVFNVLNEWVFRRKLRGDKK